MRKAFTNLLLAAVLAAGAKAALVAPAWKSPMASESHCLEVSASAEHNFTDNSRWLWSALPSTPEAGVPEKGFPFVISLAIIPFKGPAADTASPCYVAQHTPKPDPWNPNGPPANNSFWEES